MRRFVFRPIAFGIAGSLSLSLSAFAHNIDVNQAKQKVEAYASKVAKERNYPYFKVKCHSMFPGHNHQVLCFAKYQNKNTKAAGRYSCVEQITVYFQSHHGDKRNGEYYMAHRPSNEFVPEPCGNETLTGPIP